VGLPGLYIDAANEYSSTMPRFGAKEMAI